MEDQVNCQGVLEEQNDVDHSTYKDLDVDFFNDFVSFGDNSGLPLNVPLVEGECSEGCQTPQRAYNPTNSLPDLNQDIQQNNLNAVSSITDLVPTAESHSNILRLPTPDWMTNASLDGEVLQCHGPAVKHWSNPTDNHQTNFTQSRVVNNLPQTMSQASIPSDPMILANMEPFSIGMPPHQGGSTPGGIHRGGNLNLQLNSTEQIEQNHPVSISIRGLPTSTTEITLTSSMSWCSDFISARIMESDPQGIPGWLSAELSFSSIHGAQTARDAMSWMLAIVNKEAPLLAFEVCTTSHPAEAKQPPDFIAGSRRHRLSSKDKSYLQQQFATNPKPTATQRHAMAVRLGVANKRVETWFNNQRQRTKQQGNKSPHSLR
jgi:hypothetical protein